MSPLMAAAGQFLLLVVILLLVQRPLGDYLARSLSTDRHLRVERGVYRLIGVDPQGDQRWGVYLRSVIVFSIASILLVFAVLRLQSWLPYSLDRGDMPSFQAMNTAISFVTNTNWQSYSGETLGYAAQAGALAVQNFLSAAVGIAVAVALVRGLTRTDTSRLGSFWVDLTRIVVRILLPLAVVAAFVLVVGGVIQNFSGDQAVTTLAGGTQSIPGGPVASQAAGIDVISTVNIQHLESVNDVVESITGIKQRETVPDPVVRSADQIELVDMSPEALRRRMAHGNIYAADKVDAALGNYFRVGNLTALRELALLWVADRVEEGLDRYREAHGIDQTWASKQRIVVAVTGGSESGTLLRRAAVITGRSAGRELLAVHVVRSDGTAGTPPQDLAAIRGLVQDLGGSFHTVVDDSVPAAVLTFARSVNATQIVVGASRRGRFRSSLLPNTVDMIVRDSDEIDVHVVTHERAGRGAPHHRRRITDTRRRLAWGAAVAIPVLVTLALLPLSDGLSLSTVLLAYLLGVVASSLIGGVLPAFLTALVAAFLANYFFTPPTGRLTIADGENAFALVVLVTVGVVVAAVVDRSAARLEAANRSQAEAAVLAAMSTGVLTRQDGVRGLLEQACETFRMSGATLFEGDAGEPLRDPRAIEAFGAQAPRAPDDADVVVEAGPGLTLALTGRPLRTSDRRLLNAFAQQTAAVLERNRLAVRAADAQRLREVDATRTALLQAVSHDLRTPLAGLKTSLETLADPQLDLPDSERNQLVADALASTGRLQSMVLNLLDLSRLQAGGLRPQLAEASLAEVITAAKMSLATEMISDETPEVLPLLVTDAALLERILANLLANAVQHSEPGVPVRISASAVPADRVAIRVIDRGAGVPDRAKTRMFEPFQRLDDTGSGVGLGLAVARGLADSIGAELEAEDTPGGGLTMVVTVPAVPGTGEST